MNGHADPQTANYIRYGVIGVVILALYAARFLRAGKARPLQPAGLLIRPIIYVILLGLFLFWAQPYDAQSLGILAGCLLLGAAIGYWRGKMIHIEVHPETHSITQTVPVFAVALIVILLVIRYAIRLVLFPNMDLASHQSMLINAYFIAFAAGALGVTPLEMYVRANRLLAESKAAKAARGA